VHVSASRQPTARPTLPARPLPTPVRTRLNGSDIAAAAVGITAVVVGIWVRHGGLAALWTGWGSAWTSLTQLTGLLASLGGLAGLVLIARPRALEQRLGLDRLFVWHRVLGETMAVLVGAHVVAGIVAWSNGGVAAAVVDLTGRQPYMATATVGALLIGVVTVSSLRSIRRRLAYETWYFAHLLAYGALALSFSHQIVLGGDFADDVLARWMWIALHLGAVALVLWGRVGRTVTAALRPLRVVARRSVGPATTELTLAGPALRTLRADAGQFVLLRPVRRDLWWQAHPFSLSAAPTTEGLRFTVKDRGDASRAFTQLPVGAKVVIEGPYGACTPDVVGDRRVLFIVGGVGVAPAKAMLERLGPASAPIVLYRAHRDDDLVHLDELRGLALERGGAVYTLTGPTATLAVRDPYAAPVLGGLVPDLASRTAVLCGPERLLHAARAGLRAAGMAPEHIRFERPWW
jgi:predicted ferric reductase